MLILILNYTLAQRSFVGRGPGGSSYLAKGTSMSASARSVALLDGTRNCRDLLPWGASRICPCREERLGLRL